MIPTRAAPEFEIQHYPEYDSCVIYKGCLDDGTSDS